MKADPEDLKRLAEDLTDTIVDHPDALKHNPDLAIDIRKARDKAQSLYDRITEKHEDPTAGRVM